MVVKALLDSSITRLVMSSKFTRKNKFKKRKLKELIYVRNMNSTFNHERLIEHIVEIELFFIRDIKRKHK